MKQKIGLFLLFVFIGIQFIRPTRNEFSLVTVNDISRQYYLPDAVKNILERSCNDCHTNYTRYPWYTNIQPIGWWMQEHIDDGKRSLNFSKFGSYTPKDQDHVMEEFREVIEKEEMPLKSYLWMHGEAQLSPKEKALLIDWAKKLQAEIAAVK